ncbi:MAG TPA: FAD:protein FMN transferase [Candidatus Mediterraneibacter intestinipullorum]|nr:FAD:protein FMN transferase [Candidatus Mediterraneibacter intestinipullorum]
MRHRTSVGSHLITFFIISSLIAISAGGCSSPLETESLKMTGTYFDTVIQVEAWGAQRDVLDRCEEICAYYENLLSPSIETSEISEINRAQGSPVTVSDETAELLRLGIRYGELSGGRFDITIASASDLWDFKDNESGTLPDAQTLEEAVSHIDYRCIQIDGNTVTLTDPQAKIDLGGIAKGYIADQLKDYLKSAGIKHAMINLGGNVHTLGGRYDGTDFRIGIQKPFADGGTVLGTVSISDCSVVSSGDYERYFEKDGVIYHHILDPDTGYPVQNDLDQVTVISDRSVDGDALSTTCYVLGLEDGMKLLQGMEGIEAVFVTKDGAVHLSSEQVPFSGQP